MSRYVLDCCSLLNLYCGWGGIRELNDFGENWGIGQTALREARYVYEFESDGSRARVEISQESLLRQHPLSILRLNSSEIPLLVELAAKLDDGEAEGMVLAFRRGLVFVSDDRPTQRVATELGFSTPIVSTPELLIEWAGDNPERLNRLPSIVRRIEQLAKFRPHKGSPHLAWWLEILEKQMK